jgi:hypothetical protein
MKVNNETGAADFAELVNLMSEHAKAKNCLAALEADTQTEFLGLVDGHKGEYAELQRAVTETEAAIEWIAVRHIDDWFKDARTVKTPFGSVSLRRSSALAVPNQELTVVLIQQLIKEQGAGGPAAALLRTWVEPNLEALEKLDDESLASLRIKRVTSEMCRVTAAKIDLGRAVKESLAAGPQAGEVSSK